MIQDYIVGTFVREEKNRFLCTVTVEGKDEECYIPSSCRLENFLELAGKEVLLRKNQGKNARTRFTVYALKIKNNYLMLRTAEANEIILCAIKNRRFAYLGKRTLIERECNIDGYKADLFLPETKTIIEIKSIITTCKIAVFPTVYSERAIKQLKKVKMLQQDGYKFVYIFVSLNPYVKAVCISEDVRQFEYKKWFIESVHNGMMCRAYTSKFDGNRSIIRGEIPIILENKTEG